MTSNSSLLSCTWRLVELSREEVKTADVRKAKPDIHFEEEDKVFGHGGCNRFFGSYELSGDRLKFGPLASTRMYCQETMAVEDAFFRLLDLTRIWSLSGDELLLRSEDGSAWLRFRPAEEAEGKDRPRKRKQTGSGHVAKSNQAKPSHRTARR